MRRKIDLGLLAGVVFAGFTVLAGAAGMPLVDAHIHYSHDAWQRTPPSEAVRVLRSAGLKYAFVSSSSDEGTQKLYNIAPELIVPVLRPYRKRGEISSWMYDETVVSMLSERLARNYYAGIGEYADWSRSWLVSLPAEHAENIAYRNAEALLKLVGK
jgi:hypothetical protein